MEIHCKYCGKLIDSDAVYCPFCGKSQSGMVNNNKSSYLMKVVVAILVVIIIGLVIYIITTNNGSSSSREPSVMTTEQRDTLAAKFAKKVICDMLYIPSSYDPVSISVDSLCHTPYVDSNCLADAEKIIEIENKILGEENSLSSAQDDINFFAGVGGYHYNEAKKKASAAKTELAKLKVSLDSLKNVLVEDAGKCDKRYIGWVIVHKYRAANNAGNVSFGNYIIFTDSTFTQNYGVMSLDESDKNCFQKYEKVISKVIE